LSDTEFIQGIVEAQLSEAEKSESFLQSPAWGRFKGRFGWQARVFLISFAGNGRGASPPPPSPLLALFRGIAPGLSFVYVPWGPEGFSFEPADRGAALAELAKKLRPFFPAKTAFVRFDPPWFADSEGERPVFAAPFKKAPADIQPPDTVLVDLTQSEEQLLAAMKPKWRYNIGLAEKRGVQVTDAGVQGIDVFYKLLQETALRDGIAVHGINYYKALFDVFTEPDAKLCLYTAAAGGDAIAAIVVLCRGSHAVYLYGASSNVGRNLMPAYALQWRAMRDAKAAGCVRYDLFGIPPNDNPDHPMAGLYRFKTGFGGCIVHRAGSWDYPYRGAIYGLFCMAEAARKKLRDLKKKKPEKS